MSRRTGTITTLEEHPNLGEVLGVLAQLAHVQDADLPRLAAAWHNTVAVAEARDRALSPDSPLVIEVLAAFESVTALFDDDLRGEAAYVTVDCDVTTTALKAIRDAIAAAYAKPVLSRGDHAGLMRAWRAVYPSDTVDEPDLGPRGDQVKAVLAMLPALSSRCHDVEGRRVYDALVDRSFTDEGGRAEARAEAFEAAVLTSRRRVWALVRRSGTEGLLRSCSTCGAVPVEDREHERVLTLCLDAACALLVADTLADETTRLLTEPVTSLIPTQRGPSS